MTSENTQRSPEQFKKEARERAYEYECKYE